MSGTCEVSADGGMAQRLRLAPGEQVLAFHADPAAVFDELPDEAFDDLLVVGSRFGPDRLAAVVEKRGRDPAAVRLIPVGVGTIQEGGPVRTTRTVQPSDLTGLSIQLGRLLDDLEPDRSWVVVDTLGVLLVYASRERVARFLHWLTSVLRSNSVRGVYGVPAGTTTDETNGVLSQCTDRRLDLG